MITYSLAKQLKDAGFPQNGKYDMGTSWINIDNKTSYYKVDDSQIYVPGISQLIDACGDNLNDIHHFSGGWGCNKSEICLTCNPEGWDEYKVFGATIDEAVANLWIELN